MSNKHKHKRKIKPPAKPLPTGLARQVQSDSGFPTPPIVATRLIALARQQEPEITQVVDIIETDAALTAKVLRVANSPRYLGLNKIGTLRRALVLMGVNEGLSVGLSFSLVQPLRDVKPNGLDHSLFWRRSLLAAIGAQCLGEATRSPIREEMFLIALLQDIGMLALSKIDPNFYAGPLGLGIKHGALTDLEDQRFGGDHADVGAFLLRSWNLPDRAVEAVRFSNLPSREFAKSESEKCNAIVAISGLLADLFLNARTEESCSVVMRCARQSLGLNGKAVGVILDRMSAIMPDTEAMFAVNFAHNTEAIVAEAQGLIASIRFRIERDSTDDAL